jgi:hypothetical protein
MPDPVLTDDRLFDEVIGLLAALEQRRAKAADRGADPVGIESLELIATVTNAIVEFVTARCRESRVLPSRVLAQLAESDPYTQMLGEDNERISVATVEALLSSWNGPETDRQRMLDDLCRALLGAYGEAVSGLFRDARPRDEWQAMFAVFVDDLRAAAQQLAA